MSADFSAKDGCPQKVFAENSSIEVRYDEVRGGYALSVPPNQACCEITVPCCCAPTTPKGGDLLFNGTTLQEYNGVYWANREVARGTTIKCSNSCKRYKLSGQSGDPTQANFIQNWVEVQPDTEFDFFGSCGATKPLGFSQGKPSSTGALPPPIGWAHLDAEGLWVYTETGYVLQENYGSALYRCSWKWNEDEGKFLESNGLFLLDKDREPFEINQSICDRIEQKDECTEIEKTTPLLSCGKKQCPGEGEEDSLITWTPCAILGLLELEITYEADSGVELFEVGEDDDGCKQVIKGKTLKAGDGIEITSVEGIVTINLEDCPSDLSGIGDLETGKVYLKTCGGLRGVDLTPQLQWDAANKLLTVMVAGNTNTITLV